MSIYKLAVNDIKDAELFLSTFLSEYVPEGSFDEGSSLRDLAVTSFAYIYAYLRGEIDNVRLRQSLLRIQEELTVEGNIEDTDITESIQEILSNWLISRKDGSQARVNAQVYFSSTEDNVIPLGTMFWKTSTQMFELDYDTDYVISRSSMLPVYSVDTNSNTMYVASIPLKAQGTGVTYSIPAGKFVNITPPRPIKNLLYAENQDTTITGKDPETPEELIERAGTSITVRNLVNVKSCDATLREQFSNLGKTTTIGMGDPEMQRDILPGFSGITQLHIGGRYDTYINTPMTMREVFLTVGAVGYTVSTKPITFHDPYLTYDLGRTFKTVLGIQPGYVIRIVSGIAKAPQSYIIASVSDHEIIVNSANPFTEASDELNESGVYYSIGFNAPYFNQVDLDLSDPGTNARLSQASGSHTLPHGTSRKSAVAGAVTLPSEPIINIEFVELLEPPISNLVDASTQTIIFHNRVNHDDAGHRRPPIPLSNAETSYVIKTLNPNEVNSSRALTQLLIGYEATPGIFDGYKLRVKYNTLVDFHSIDSYVRNPETRILGADHLVKSRHPVWITVSFNYRPKPNAVDPVNEVNVANQVSWFINNFNHADDLDTSDIHLIIRESDASIGSVSDITVNYILTSPDGQLVYFYTSDVVAVYADTLDDSNGITCDFERSNLIVPEELVDNGVLSIDDNNSLHSYFDYMGISNRTIMYLTKPSFINVVAKEILSGTVY